MLIGQTPLDTSTRRSHEYNIITCIINHNKCKNKCQLNELPHLKRERNYQCLECVLSARALVLNDEGPLTSFYKMLRRLNSLLNPQIEKSRYLNFSNELQD